MSEIQANEGREYQFRLWQVFLWVFASTLVPATHQAIGSPQSWESGYPGDLIERLARFSTLLIALHCPVYGAYIAGTIIGLWHLRSHRQFPLHPGHTLLIVECACLAFAFPVQLAVFTLISQGSDSTLVSYWLRALINGFEAIAFGLAIRFGVERGWRFVFVGIAAFIALEFTIAIWLIVAHWMRWSPPTFYFGWFNEAVSVCKTIWIVMLLTIASYRDFHRGIARDWLHWTGVVCVGLDQIVYSIGDIGFDLIQQTYNWQHAA